MGVRLYPITKSPEVLCKLAGVPKETWEKEKTLPSSFEWCQEQHLPPLRTNDGREEARMPDGSWVATDNKSQGEGYGEDYSYLLYKWLHRIHPDVMALRDFILSGWGRITFPEHWSVGDYDDSCEFNYCCGKVEDPHKVAELLVSNNISLAFTGLTVEDLEGLCWG